MQRREFLNLARLAGGALLTSRVAFARPAERRARFVLIIMRGALDGLAAVAPYGDRDYAGLRGEFALRSPGETGGPYRSTVSSACIRRLAFCSSATRRAS